MKKWHEKLGKEEVYLSYYIEDARIRIPVNSPRKKDDVGTVGYIRFGSGKEFRTSNKSTVFYDATNRGEEITKEEYYKRIGSGNWKEALKSPFKLTPVKLTPEELGLVKVRLKAKKS